MNDRSTYSNCSRISFSSACIVGNWGYGTWTCTDEYCDYWSAYYYRTTIFVEF